MDPRTEIREFLATRRAKITPGQAGVPRYGGRRRVPGLRREEVAVLATASPQFRTRWAAHSVQLHHTGVKRLRHPVVGVIEVAYNTLDIPAQPGLVLTFYTAHPGSPSADALRLLASWAATIHESDRQNTGQQTLGAAGGQAGIGAVLAEPDPE
jgi:MmyB-like transcription regulator ligand binding domain